MSRAPLHLVDTAGNPVRTSVRVAVEDAFHWVVRRHPLVDPALIANWAEEVASFMQSMDANLGSPGRYADVALRGKVRDWQRTKPAKQQPMGIGPDLERIGGADRQVQAVLDRKVFFEQVRATLSERDQVIMLLLLDGLDDFEIASALAVTYAAGRKAIQRVKQRMAAAASGDRTKNYPGQGSPTLCETKG